MLRGVWVGKVTVSFPTLHTLFNTLSLPKHTGPSYKPYCMPSLTVALLLLEWLHDGVYAGRSVSVYACARDTDNKHQPRTNTISSIS